jgi:formamidopyrimidine-DNA glycosylase
VPELPDVAVYVERLRALTTGRALAGISIRSPFVLRTVSPPASSLVGRPVRDVRRIGKRIALGFAPETWLVIHLMIAGRLRWKPAVPSAGAKDVLAVLSWPDGHLVFTEASPKKRASMHVVEGDAALAQFDRGGLEPVGSTREAFAAVLRAERHTVKRTLTDPTLFSGIGNAYSDEILHRAGLSPARWTTNLDPAEIDRLYDATQEILVTWTDRLRAETGDGFPDKVTAFRPEFAVHGKYRQPCPVCGTPVQRIAYADNETNYCPTCQTQGKLLADRALSQLLKGDWPKTLEELEERKAAARERT